MSLRLRLLLTLAPLFVLGLIAADVGTYTALQNFMVSRIDGQLIDVHQDVERAIVGTEGNAGSGCGGPHAFTPWTYGEIRTPSGTVVTQCTFSGPGSSQATAHPVLPSNLSVNPTIPSRYLSVPGSGAVSQYRVYVDTPQDPTYQGDLLVVAIPLDDVNTTLHQLLFLELGISGVVTLIVVLATWVVVRRGLRPLERMGDTARTIVLSDLSRRVEPSNETTEVGRLGLALNSMLSQLETAFAERQRNEQRLRHFISDASHELRTPLTSMQGYTELLQRNPEMEREDLEISLGRMEGETKRMGVLVDDLLLLARLDQGRPLARERVDLEALVTDACADAGVVDPTRAVTARISAPLVVTGDDMRLRQVLGNLVRNALVHTPAGAPIEIALRRESRLAVIEVIDHGPGIPPGHADRIFERFHRADPDRSGDRGGSGLGLSIAAAVVAAHSGHIGVSATPGGGATFRIDLPLVEEGESPRAATAEDATADAARATANPSQF